MNKTNRIFFATNIIMFLVLVSMISLFLPSCSTSTSPPGNHGQNPSTLRIPAANILFRPLNQAQAADDVNTDIKVYADQVVTSNAQTATQSDNLQQYMETTDPILSDIIVGTWTTKAFLNSEGQTVEGQITFSSDGTWTADNTGIRFINPNLQGSEVPNPLPPNDAHEYGIPIDYEILENNIVKITYQFVYTLNGEEHYQEGTTTLFIAFPKITANTITKATGLDYAIKN